MDWKSLALVGALVGAGIPQAQAQIGSVGFADIGAPTADGSLTGNINTATTFKIDDFITTLATSGFFAGMGHQDIGTVNFDITSPTSLSFTDSVFGSFTSTSFMETINNPGSLVIYVLGDWTPGTQGGITPGTYASSLTIAFTQSPAFFGSISDSGSFSVPPSVIPETSTWAMMGIGFATLALVACRSKSQAVAVAA